MRAQMRLEQCAAVTDQGRRCGKAGVTVDNGERVCRQHSTYGWVPFALGDAEQVGEHQRERMRRVTESP